MKRGGGATLRWDGALSMSSSNQVPEREGGRRREGGGEERGRDAEGHSMIAPPWEQGGGRGHGAGGMQCYSHTFCFFVPSA